MTFSEIIPTVLSIQTEPGIVITSVAFTALLVLLIANAVKAVMIKLTTNKSFKEAFVKAYTETTDFLTFSLLAVLVFTIIVLLLFYIIPILVLFSYCLFEGIYEFLLSLKA